MALAFSFEAITVFARFGLGLESTRDTKLLANFTFGWRIHHGYVGLVMLVTACFMSHTRRRAAFLVLGIALFVSDLVHHFAVLWYFTGDPHFDLRY